MAVSALLLAAGQSRRMGRPKARLPWQGTTLIQYQIAQLLDAGAGEVVIILGHAAAELWPVVAPIPEVRPVINPDYLSGRASSIRLGMAHLDAATEAVIILGVDQPRPALLIHHLLAEHQRRQALITVPSYRGHRGHPAIFARSLFPELAAVSEEGQGLRQVMQRYRGETAEIKIDDPRLLLDLNTPADYEQSLELFSPPPRLEA